MFKWNKYTIGATFLACLLTLLVGYSFVGPKASAEELLRKAQELRLKARRGHCDEIGKKVGQCYAGDMETCKTMQTSISWFTGEYGETPEVACTTVPDPLTFGDAQE